MASYYGKAHHGKRTANGETFSMQGMTAAHPTLPFGTKVRVTNLYNGNKVVPAFLLTPVLVTQANVCTAYDPTTSPSASAAALASDYCKTHK